MGATPTLALAYNVLVGHGRAVQRSAPGRAASAALLGCGVFTAGACQEPTQITLEISTNADCADVGGTTVAAGTESNIDTGDAVGGTKRCEPKTGRIGSLVLVPSGDSDRFAIRVVTGLNKTPEECVRDGYKGGCIVARRTATFVEHSSLVLPIRMQTACLDRPCADDESCEDGRCVPLACAGAESCGGDGGVEGGGGCGAGEYLSADGCRSWTSCLPGQFVSTEGTSTADRACSACPESTFNATLNAPSCAPWKTCPSGSAEVLPGTSSNDRACGWMRQFGTSASDALRAVGVDSGGNVYVAGETSGTMPGQTYAGSTDAFLKKYSTSGVEQWTRQFGVAGSDHAFSLTVDAGDNVYVAGDTTGALSGQAFAGQADAFVRKYSSSGAELWTRELGSSGVDSVNCMGIDGGGNIYVAGEVGASLPGQTSAGNFDAFVRKYDSSATEQWTRQFGTDGVDLVQGLVVDEGGIVYVAGTAGGALPGQVQAGSGDAFVRKYSASGGEVWTRQFGTSAADSVSAVGVDTGGNVYVVGVTKGILAGTSAGGDNAFVRKYDAFGVELWTRQFGASGTRASSGDLDASGRFYVAGFTAGSLPGQSSAGGVDAFIAVFDKHGADQWVWQFGTSGNDNTYGMRFASGSIHVAGSTSGVLPGQSSMGGADAFVIKILP